MEIRMKDYPELVLGIMGTAKLGDVFSEDTLTLLRREMLEDFEDVLWDDWDFGGGLFSEIQSVAIGTAGIKRETYDKVFKTMQMTLCEFEKNYPYYLEIESVAKEYKEFEKNVWSGVAIVTLGDKGGNIHGRR